MRNLTTAIFLVLLLLFIVVGTASSQVEDYAIPQEDPREELNGCQEFQFGSASEQYYIYSDGRSWDFTVGYGMHVAEIQTQSKLATNAAKDFHIEVR